MIKRLFALLFVPVCASAAVVLMPLGAQAQSAPVTITLASAGTIAKSRVVVTLAVQISCDLTLGHPGPIDPSSFFVDSNGSIAQAAGRQIATGGGFASEPIVCDGTPHPNTVTFTADPTGPPFHGGHATASFSVFIGDFSGNSESGSSGLQTISLKG